MKKKRNRAADYFNFMTKTAINICNKIINLAVISIK